MKNIYKVILLSTICHFVLSANLFAAEITFKIPLQYSNLHPDVEKIKVFCEIEGLRPTTGGDSSGRVSTVISASSIAYNKVITVKYALPKDVLKSEMKRSASCQLAFKKKGSASFSGTYQAGNPHCSGEAAWRCATPNTPYNTYSDVHELHTL